MKQQLTIIIPCAGSGKRLGLESPKELLEITPGIPLIQYSLNHIKAALPKLMHLNVQVKIVLVIRPHKAKIVNYVKSLNLDCSVVSVYFDESLEEWPGSVYSARQHFRENNVVLLPDSIVSLSRNSVYLTADGEDLCGLFLNALDRFQVVFGYVPNNEPEVLKKLGALSVDQKQRVIDFQDKPMKKFDRFNAYWGCYAFKKTAGKQLYQFLIQSVKHKPVQIQSEPFHPTGGVPLFDYMDLGSWANIEKFKHSTLFQQVHEQV